MTPSAAERAEAVITTYQEMIQEQLDEGLRAIQHSANSLMHEIAAEVWRSAAGDKETVASTILQELSRDQAIRALIAHADERFQSLAARTGRLEDTLGMLAESVRAAKEQIARSADALAESGGAPLGVGQIRTQLDEVSRQVAAAFQTLAERDQSIVETVQEQIRQHGDLITQETARIARAMQEYVQQGVEAMGQLAGTTDSQVQSISDREEAISERVRETVDRQLSELAEQMQLLYDRTAIAATSLHEMITFLGDRVGIDTRDAFGTLHRTLEERVTGLAQLVRSDSEALRRELVGRTSALDDDLSSRMTALGDDLGNRIAALDEELGGRLAKLDEDASARVAKLDEDASARVAKLDEDASARVAKLGEDVTERVTELSRDLAGGMTRLDEGLAGTTARVDEALAAGFTKLGQDVEGLDERLAGKLDERLAGRLDEQLSNIMEQTLSVIDRNMIRMVDALEQHFERLGAGVGERAANAAELAIGARFDDVLARLHEGAAAIERSGSETRSLLDETRTEMHDARNALDVRFTALAKLVRSDSETLAGQVVAGQEVTRQALRAMKELQASLPAEVIQMVDQRFGSLAESIERSNEMLAARIDRMAQTIGQRQNDDIQIVIDRMGDAMHALASLGKAGETQTRSRIDID